MPTPGARLAALLIGVLAAAGAAASPSQDYVLFCMGCHGEQAQGIPGRVPPLAHSLARYLRTSAGRSYILRVPGVAGSALSDAQITGVLNWLAETFDGEDLTPGVPLFTVDEVTRLRHTPLLSVQATRRETIRQLETDGPAPSQGY